MKFGEEVVITESNAKEVLTHMRTTGSVFANSECMVVEYYDIIKAPWYILLTVIDQNEKIRSLMNIEDLSSLSANQRFEWYCNRENRNFIKDLSNIPEDKLDYDMLLDVLMNNEIFYSTNTELNSVGAIKHAIKSKVVKKVVVIADKPKDKDSNIASYIEDDVKRIFNGKAEVKIGNFSEILPSIPIDTTYMLSDINKVIDLDNSDHLNYASIILPYDFGYNYIRENGHRTDKPLVNFDYLATDHMFKLNYFTACYK